MASGWAGSGERQDRLCELVIQMTGWEIGPSEGCLNDVLAKPCFEPFFTLSGWALHPGDFLLHLGSYRTTEEQMALLYPRTRVACEPGSVPGPV